MKASRKPAIATGLLLCVALLQAFVPKGEDPIDKRVTSLQRYTANLNQL